MKCNTFFLLILSIITLSCSDNAINDNNPFLPNYSFSTTIDLSLPQYSSLIFQGSAIGIYDANVGIKGVVIFNGGGTNNYQAFDLACPNQELSDCSTATISAPFVTCPCDGERYFLFTGLPENKNLRYPLRRYRVEMVSQNVLRISN
jgi:nitrite reductase/ring-hydroxylating ferredoxin subunit